MFDRYHLACATTALAMTVASCRPDVTTPGANEDFEIGFARQTPDHSSAILPLSTGDVENRANGVNDAGEVVGHSISTTNQFRAFVTLAGAVTELTGTNANAHAISNGSTRYVAGRSASRPARWTIVANAPGAPASLDIGTATNGSALGVNDAGGAVGFAGTSAALWDAAGVLTLVSTPTGFTRGEGRDIDNAGNSVFVFTRPDPNWEGGFATGYLRLANGVLIHLSPLAGDIVTYVNGIGPASGNLVRVAGSSYSAPSMSRAVRWTIDMSTGSIVDVEVRTEESHALALANDGVAVGFSESAGSKSTAFRWRGGALLTLTPPTRAKNGRAWAISPNGRFVAGEAMLQRRRAVLWTITAP